jgi:hypothetical protein
MTECCWPKQQPAVSWSLPMSSPEELTFVVGRWLQPVLAVLDVVRRLRPAPTSSREHRSTPRGG